ncbi:MAG: SIR2 family protein [Gammaproteobacteria bacterium]
MRNLIEKKPITHANLRLAHLLLERTVTNLVITPNFDDFLTRSLQLFGKYHVICDHPKTVERIDHEQADVQVVHVHGTYSFYDCCNLRGEIEGQARPSEEYSMGFLLDQVMYRRSPLVVGYSGWDGDVIMTAIRKRLNQGRLPRKVYWFCYKRTDADKLPEWLRDRGLKPDDDVCFVVPEEEAGQGEPAGLWSALTAASEPIEAGRGERVLDAQDVFATLIKAFELKPPSLTSDPLAYFAEHLRASLPDSSDQGVDIYFIPKVIEKIERARALERAMAEQGQRTEAALERVLEAVRSSRYSDVVAAARALAAELNNLEE